MLRASTFALASALAAALAAPAAAGEEKVYYKITLQDGTIAGAVPSSTSTGRNDGRLQQLEIHSFHWGSASAAGSWSKAEGLGVSWDTPQQGGAGRNQVEMNDTRGGEKSGGVLVASGDISGDSGGTAAPRKPTTVPGTVSPRPLPGSGGSVGANEKLTIGANQTEAGQATGKRQHLPIRMRMYYDSPQGTGPGSLIVRGSFPGCAVGKRYAGAQFAAGGKTYRLRDLKVASCGAPGDDGPTEDIIFVYGGLG